MLEIVEESAIDYEDNSKQFGKNAERLKDIMYWRNMKMNIMIGIIIGGVVLYIFLPMLPDDAFS